MQAPALLGACVCCEQIGLKLTDLATIYIGSHAFLPANNPLRGEWADQHTQHLAGVERKRAKAAAKSAVQPRSRTDASIRAAGERVDRGESDAKAEGSHGVSMFSQYLSYWNARKFVVNDPMHIFVNCGEPLCALELLTFANGSRCSF